MVSARSMLAEVKYMFAEWMQAMCNQGFDPVDISRAAAENVDACQRMIGMHEERSAGDYADDEQFRAMINEVLDTKARVVRNKENWQRKQQHLVSARSMLPEVESHVSDWAARYRHQDVDLTQYVGDVSEFCDGLIENCRNEITRVITEHEQRDIGDFNPDNLQAIRRLPLSRFIQRRRFWQPAAPTEPQSCGGCRPTTRQQHV
jgi:hypothetical protein